MFFKRLRFKADARELARRALSGGFVACDECSMMDYQIRDNEIETGEGRGRKIEIGHLPSPRERLLER